MVPAIEDLISVLRDAHTFLARPDNDFAWSSWRDANEALGELDSLIATMSAGQLPPEMKVSILFAPTGPIQEVSMSSGWAWEFIELSERFDAALKRAYTDESPLG
jgi:hypothetical protein